MAGFQTSPNGWFWVSPEAETPHVRFVVMEHRGVPVDVSYRARLLPHRDPAIDLRSTGGEYRQLQLRHPSLLPLLRLTLQLHFRLIPFSSTPRNSRDEIRRSDFADSFALDSLPVGAGYLFCLVVHVFVD